MKNPLHYIQEYPQRTTQLLGISYDQFLGLLAQAELRHAQQQAEIERTKIRLNAKGLQRTQTLWTNLHLHSCLWHQKSGGFKGLSIMSEFFLGGRA